ncbi:MAG: amino acid ABC transporter permease [Candidatus Poribacteria bacterium]|nr:amino acid ABC transporter permease [Candidatus Poribacteria bacterium]
MSFETIHKAADTLQFLLGGLQWTAALMVCSMLVGLALGLLLAAGRLSRFPLLRWPCAGYIETLRGVPLLVTLLLVVFGIPSAAPQWKLHDFWLTVAAFGACYGAYLAETFRAGIESVDVGQSEAARALGLNSTQTMAHVILPQAARNVLPALVNDAVSLLKDTSLASIAAIPEVTLLARRKVALTYDVFFVFTLLGCIYLCLTLCLSYLARILEKRGFRAESARLHSRSA